MITAPEGSVATFPIGHLTDLRLEVIEGTILVLVGSENMSTAFTPSELPALASAALAAADVVKNWSAERLTDGDLLSDLSDFLDRYADVDDGQPNRAASLKADVDWLLEGKKLPRTS